MPLAHAESSFKHEISTLVSKLQDKSVFVIHWDTASIQSHFRVAFLQTQHIYTIKVKAVNLTILFTSLIKKLVTFTNFSW